LMAEFSLTRRVSSDRESRGSRVENL
ncbi:MAG: hypothetical protein QOK26_4029, partial [Pseudonocardiales bacterium]|nr:hypothetical protein [Pseudonocardiales bacterium]